MSCRLPVASVVLVLVSVTSGCGREKVGKPHGLMDKHALDEWLTQEESLDGRIGELMNRMGSGAPSADHTDRPPRPGSETESLQNLADALRRSPDSAVVAFELYSATVGLQADLSNCAAIARQGGPGIDRDEIERLADEAWKQRVSMAMHLDALLSLRDREAGIETEIGKWNLIESK